MKKSGFTLLEISVVTILLGILLALAMMAIMKGIRNSRIRNAEAELEILSAAVLQLAWDTGKWPNERPRTAGGSTEMWDISEDRCGLLGNNGNYIHWKGPYYEGALRDPWGNRYFFDPDYRHREKDGTVRNAVVVGSFGPNGRGPNQYDSDDVYVLLDD